MLAISEMCTKPSMPSPRSTKSAERDKLGHSALDDSADGVLLDQCAPRILGGLLETQGDALAVEIDVENLDLDLLADP